MNKREFIQRSCLAAGGIMCLKQTAKMPLEEKPVSGYAKGDKLWKWSKESMFYEQTPRGTKCLLCPTECTLHEGEMSICRNRVNVDDKLYSIAYGNPCAVHVDPVEKKPLFHFMPESWSYSIATAGCNFACLNCQNWTISQVSPRETRNEDLMPGVVVKACLSNSCKSISYTYAEPVTFYEYVYDTSRIAREHGLKNIFISNGYINEIPLKNLCKYLDAANINLKSFSDDTYMRLNSGKLQPVLDSLKAIRDSGVWLEITNLVVPNWTDNMDMIRRMCDWLVENGFQSNPLHFLRFQPLYKLTQLPPTPISVLYTARETAIKAGINFVYIGNVPGSEGQNTYCPVCKKLIVERNGFAITKNYIERNACKFCGTRIEGRWQ